MASPFCCSLVAGQHLVGLPSRGLQFSLEESSFLIENVDFLIRMEDWFRFAVGVMNDDLELTK